MAYRLAEMQQITDWLNQLGMSEYAQRFVENGIDLSVLPDLTEQDLKEMGVILGHRRKILRAIANLEAEKSATVVPDAPAVPAPVSQTDSAERRPVAVLFADLCGFTALSRDLPDERLHTLLGRYLGVADDIVKRHGGTVDKHIGDAVMALFGAPVAHDDDMLRAFVTCSISEPGTSAIRCGDWLTACWGCRRMPRPIQGWRR